MTIVENIQATARIARNRDIDTLNGEFILSYLSDGKPLVWDLSKDKSIVLFNRSKDAYEALISNLYSSASVTRIPFHYITIDSPANPNLSFSSTTFDDLKAYFNILSKGYSKFTKSVVFINVGKSYNTLTREDKEILVDFLEWSKDATPNVILHSSRFEDLTEDATVFLKADRIYINERDIKLRILENTLEKKPLRKPETLNLHDSILSRVSDLPDINDEPEDYRNLDLEILTNVITEKQHIESILKSTLEYRKALLNNILKWH